MSKIKIEGNSGDGDWNSPGKGVKSEPTEAEDTEVSENRYRVFVAGLGFGVQSSELLEYFEQFGDVLSAESHPTRGFGYVSFMDAESMKKVLDQPAHEILGRKIKLRVANPKALPQNEGDCPSNLHGPQKEEPIVKREDPIIKTEDPATNVRRDPAAASPSNQFIPGNYVPNPLSTPHQMPSFPSALPPRRNPPIPTRATPAPTPSSQSRIVTDFGWTPPPPVNNEPPPPGEGGSAAGTRGWYATGSTSGFHYSLNSSPPSTPPSVSQPPPPNPFPNGPPPLPLPKERYLDYGDHDAPLPPPMPFPFETSGATDPIFLQHLASSRLSQRYYNYVRTDPTNAEAGRPERVYRKFLHHPSAHPYSRS